MISLLGMLTMQVSFVGGLAIGAATVVTVTTRKLKVRTLLTLFGSALASGEMLRKSKQVDYRTDLESVTFRGHKPFPHQVDGDYLGESEKLSVTHGEASIRLIVPQGV